MTAATDPEWLSRNLREEADEADLTAVLELRRSIAIFHYAAASTESPDRIMERRASPYSEALTCGRLPARRCTETLAERVGRAAPLRRLITPGNTRSGQASGREPIVISKFSIPVPS